MSSTESFCEVTDFSLMMYVGLLQSFCPKLSPFLAVDLKLFQIFNNLFHSDVTTKMSLLPLHSNFKDIKDRNAEFTLKCHDFTTVLNKSYQTL